MTKIALTGAAGRMGRRITALAVESEQFDIVSAVEAGGHPDVGKDIGDLAGVGAFGVAIGAELAGEPDVLVDFSQPECTLQYLGICRERKIAMVTGTTGLTPSQQAEVADAAGQIPIVQAANYSVGINVMLKIVGEVARVLGDDYDIEVCETHHRFKKDAPSGTAITLTKAICEAIGRDYGETVVFGRGGHCPRKPGEIGMHALRIGDDVGRHAIHFGNLGETITLGHAAHTRDPLVRGALRAAQWVVAKPPGLYAVRDVLGM